MARLRHLAFAMAVPLQAGGQRGVEPPADPLHRRRQQQGLGEGQAPGPAGMGGIDDHRNPRGDGLDQPLLEALLDVNPGALHGRIAKDLGPDRIGGEHQGRRFSSGGEQGRQGSGQGGLAAGRRADQQMAAQRRLCGGGQGSRRRDGSSLSQVNCSRQGLACGCWAKQLVCYTKLNHLVHSIRYAFPDR